MTTPVTTEATDLPAPTPPADTPARAGVARRLAPFAAPAGAMALVIWLGFNAGGFFPGTVGYAAIGVGLVLLVWLTTADRPFASASGPLALAVGALTLYAVWTLMSADWSDATSRALIEFDRALLYLAPARRCRADDRAASAARAASSGASPPPRSSSAAPGSSPACCRTCGRSGRRSRPTA